MSDQNALQENLLGKAAYEKRDFSGAISHYEKAILLDPTQMVFHDNLAAVYLETDFLEKCVRSCETAMEVGRVHGTDSKLVAKVLRRLASAHRKMGNITVAEALGEKEETILDNRSTGFFQSENETERGQAELRRKEKELIDIKRKLLDVQIAEARKQLNAGPRSAPSANSIRASRKEKEPSSSSNSFLHVQIAEARKQLNTAPRCASPANPIRASRKEKEPRSSSNSFLHVQIAEARKQLNTGPRSASPANPIRASTKEKEQRSSSNSFLDVQMSEARGLMNIGATNDPPANPIYASTKERELRKEDIKRKLKAALERSEENSKGEAMSNKKIKQSFAEKLTEKGSKMFFPKAGEDSDRSDEEKEEDSDSCEESVDYENVITFKVFKYGPDDPSPFVSLSDVERDVSVMHKADEIVVPEDRKSISVVFEAYLKDKFVFELESPTGKGFTRGELVTAIANKYKEIYQEEEETSTLPVETMKERSARLGGGAGCNLINRAQTEGKYGIWGHDLSDLTLDEVVFNPEQNRYHLEISS